MSLQFNVNKSLMGDVTVQGGVIIDTTQSPTASILIDHDVGEAVQSDPNTNSYSPAPIPSGGSGRNIIIQKTPYSGLPDGLFYAYDNDKWVNAKSGSIYSLVYLVSGSSSSYEQEFKLFDSSNNLIATAPYGSIKSNTSIQCSSLCENGGPTESIGLLKYVYLGSSTGVVNFNYSSLVGNCRFIVRYDGSDVITVTGSGVAQFTKSSSNKFAEVWVTSLTEAAKWEFNLGCPGGTPSPITPPIGRVTFNATLTTYGLTLTGGVNIPIVCTYEGDPNIKTCSITSEGIMGIYSMRSDGIKRFYDDVNLNTAIKISQLGSSFTEYTLYDYGGRIANLFELFVSQYDISSTDPTESYESFTYGADKYNAGVPFNVFVQLNDNPSLTLVHYYVLNLTGGGSISSYEGPISAPTLPANTSTKKHIPVASFDSSINTLLQLWEGPILLR